MSSNGTPRQPASQKVGILFVEVIEAEALPEKKKKVAKLFVEATIDSDTHYTPAVDRIANPVWDDSFEVDITHRTEELILRVFDGKPGANGNKLLCSAHVPLKVMSGATVDDWFDLVDHKRRAAGRIHVHFQPTISGMSRLLSTVAVDAAAAQMDEKESMRQLLLAAPELVKEMRFAVFRLIYALEPLLELRKGIVELFLWKNKVSSGFAFALFCYVSYANQFLSSFGFACAGLLAFTAVRALQARGRAFVRANAFESRQELMDAAVVIKDRTRIGAKTSILTDLRGVLAALNRIATTVEDLREHENDASWLGRVAGAFAALALLLLYLPIQYLAPLVVRVGVTLGGLYMFTLFALYAHYPVFRERYTPRVLARKLLQSLQFWRRRAPPLSHTVSTHAHDHEDVTAAMPRAEIWRMALCLADKKTGVPVLTHRFSLKRKKRKLEDTFVAREAVDWLYSNMKLDSRRVAVAVFRRMALFGAVLLVADDNEVFEQSGTLPRQPANMKAHPSLSVASNEGLAVARSARVIAASMAAAQSGSRDKLRRLLPTDERASSAHAFGTADVALPADVAARAVQDSSKQLWRFNEAKLSPWRSQMGSSVLSEQQLAKLLDPTLTPRDWQLLLTNSMEVVFKPNEVLIQQGENNKNIYRIKEGRARVMKQIDTDTPAMLLTTVGPNTMLGELSALDARMLASASVIADTSVTVHRCAITFIMSLFQTEPVLCRRFFHTVALSLAGRLDSMHQSGDTNAQREPANSDDTTKLPREHAGKDMLQAVNKGFKQLGTRLQHTANVATNAATRLAAQAGARGRARLKQQDDQFLSLFGVKNEVVICELPCSYRLTITRTDGQFFLSQRYVAFYSRSFGRMHKILLPYKEIADIEPGSGARALKISTKSNRRYKFTFRDDAALQQVLSLTPALLVGMPQSPGRTSRRVSSLGAEQSPALQRAGVELTASTDETTEDPDSASSQSRKKKRKKKKSLDNGDDEERSETPRRKKKKKRRDESSSPIVIGLLRARPTTISTVAVNSDALDRVIDADTASIDGDSEDDEYDEDTDASVQLVDSVEVGENSILSPDDWDVILACSYVASFTTDETVMARDTAPLGILQIVRGRCRIQRGGTVLGFVEAGSMLGEVSFLRHSLPTADVFADSDVEVQVICSRKLRALFVQQPALAGRAYHYLAWVLQERISERQRLLDAAGSDNSASSDNVGTHNNATKSQAMKKND